MMTPEKKAARRAAKKERLAARHTLQRAVRKHLSKTIKLVSTTKQLDAAARKIADQLFAGKNPALVMPLFAVPPELVHDSDQSRHYCSGHHGRVHVRAAPVEA
jgi:hypothetical protein